MDVLLGIIFPIFGIMAVGFGATFTPVFDEAARKGLAQFVFFFAIPVMLFHKLATAELPETISIGYLVAFYGAAVLTFGICLPLYARLAGEPVKRQVLTGFGTIYGNVVLIGIPVVLAAYGDVAAVPMFLLISFHTTFQYTFITVIIEGWAQPESESGESLFWRVLKSLVKNPILMGMFSGVLFNLSNLPLPDLVDRFAGLFGQAGIPCALFSLGASLRGYKLAGALKVVFAMSAAKLILMPFLFWLIATTFFDVPPLYLSVGLVLAAMPAGVNSYLFAVRYKQSEVEVAAAVLLTTLMAVPVLAILIATGGQP